MEKQRTTAQIVRGYKGPALFSFGFRPFFLFSAVFAALAVPLWIAAMLGAGDMASVITRDWHAHEMLFGYTLAVITGYMIIAGANWTGHYPVAGFPVMVLVSLWLAGRVVMLLPGANPILILLVDGAFPIVFAGAMWREQLSARNGRNLVPCLVMTFLGLANIIFHLREFWPELGAVSVRMALGLIVVLIVVMGGRLVPSFTRNWLAQRGTKREPIPYGRLDWGIASFVAVSLIVWQFWPQTQLTGVLLLLSSGGICIRLIRWRGWETWSEPLVWSLHISYLWLGVGLFLLGIAIVPPGHVSEDSAMHALTAGGIGTMTLAMMTRTTLSHTGRERRSGMAAFMSFLLISLAAILRTAAPFISEFYTQLLVISALFWGGGFLIFILVYGPMLVRPRYRAKKDR